MVDFIPVDHDPFENLTNANQELGLSSQEKALYERHLGNLTGPGGVDNDGSNPNAPAGSRSTLFVNSFGIGGKTYVIPSVWGGKILAPDESFAMAKKEGLDKFPAYASDEEATSRYGQMHDYMQKDTQQFLQARQDAQRQHGIDLLKQKFEENQKSVKPLWRGNEMESQRYRTGSMRDNIDNVPERQRPIFY